MSLREKLFWILAFACITTQGVFYWLDAANVIHWSFYVEAIPSFAFIAVLFSDLRTGYLTKKRSK